MGFTLLLIVATMLPVVSHVTPVYLASMLVAGAYFLYYVMKLMQSTSRTFASKVVHASVLYLPLVLAMMIAYKR